MGKMSEVDFEQEIETAVMKERERCAKLAEDTYIVPSHGLHPYQVNAANLRARVIAEIIRKPLSSQPQKGE